MSAAQQMHPTPLQALAEAEKSLRELELDRARREAWQAAAYCDEATRELALAEWKRAVDAFNAASAWAETSGAWVAEGVPF